MAGNDYAEGSLEWHAWGEGNDYAARTNGVYDNPLSGEWADMPSLTDVGILTARHVFGADYGTADYARDRMDGVIADDDACAIYDAFEQGYADWREGY